jgi:tyrosinase
MDHSSHSGMHSHPKTFDEVIARGFPHDRLDVLRKEHEQRTRGRLLVFRPRLTLRDAATSVGIRKNGQTGFTPAEQAAFRNAVTQLVQEGKYQELVSHHMDMSHNMHGSMGETGLHRFLAWHRRYLVEFERELQRADTLLRPGQPSTLAVPYWPWQNPFPEWLAGFLPALDPQTGQVPPGGKNAQPPEKANAADLDLLINHFAAQSTQIPGENDYTKFTYGLEGWGKRPDGSKLPAHNQGHAWIGGIMNNMSTSPTDPIFWLHHAEVDRLWQIWRQTHATVGPPLKGADRIMDPWPESYDELLDVSSLGYTYDSMSP